MTFSIIVPIYNVEKYLNDCIDSILGQSYKDFELILVDDGSTDKSSTICDEYASKDNRIKVIHKQNGGLTSSRKAGARVAKGDYIICIDGDDYIKPGYLANASLLIKSNVDVICYNFVYDTGDEYKNLINEGIYSGSDVFSAFMIDEKEKLPNEGNLCYTIWSKIVKRELYIKSQEKVADNISIGEDLLLFSFILKDCNSVLINKNCFYVYRTNPNSITRNYNVKMVLQYTDVTKELLKVYVGREQKVYRYALQSLLKLYARLAKVSKGFRDFKIQLENVDYCKEIKKIALCVKPKGIGIKYHIALILIRINAIRFLYKFYR